MSTMTESRTEVNFSTGSAGKKFKSLTMKQHYLRLATLSTDSNTDSMSWYKSNEGQLHEASLQGQLCVAIPDLYMLSEPCVLVVNNE